MAELQTLNQLGSALGAERDVAEAPVHVQKLDAQGRAYATGSARTPSPACG